MLKIGLKRWALVETARPRLFSHSNCAASRISTKCQAQALTWAELHYSSRLARWAGLCYYPAAELPALVEV
ncbi:hypothetical protein HaLaN_07808 [Haematococcus lacustris]|uniref:Uncharacterized protein n=1 Tax=Haematococcus lacustris TaxID=44745 RepID=A0A699YRF1_HAELA|nr:hypothetical protein HaLaN_07808 [Haematococcus lacustris]